MIGAIEEYFLQNTFPPLGNALSARSSVRNEQVHRFIQDVLVEVNLKLWKLEQRVDKEYMKDNEKFGCVRQIFLYFLEFLKDMLFRLIRVFQNLPLIELFLDHF